MQGGGGKKEHFKVGVGGSGEQVVMDGWNQSMRGKEMEAEQIMQEWRH